MYFIHLLVTSPSLYYFPFLAWIHNSLTHKKCLEEEIVCNHLEDLSEVFLVGFLVTAGRWGFLMASRWINNLSLWRLSDSLFFSTNNRFILFFTFNVSILFSFFLACLFIFLTPFQPQLESLSHGGCQEKGPVRG